MRDFLWSMAMTVAAIGIPTLLHWLWTGRARPLQASYGRVLAYFIRWFGTIYSFVAAIISLTASADLLFGRGLGYPGWAPFFGATMIAVGLILRWVAGQWLEHQRAPPVTAEFGVRPAGSDPGSDPRPIA
jgi:hypothetical protein